MSDMYEEVFGRLELREVVRPRIGICGSHVLTIDSHGDRFLLACVSCGGRWLSKDVAGDGWFDTSPFKKTIEEEARL